MARRRSFCGSTAGPFNVGGLFTALMCADCQAARGHGSALYPVMTRAEMRAGLELLPTWALEQKAAANRQVIAVMDQRLAAGEQVARMYQEPGLAWLERQAEVAEDLVAERRRQRSGTADVVVAPQRPVPCEANWGRPGSGRCCPGQPSHQNDNRQRPWLSVIGAYAAPIWPSCGS
jgi:hypothetical protein